MESMIDQGLIPRLLKLIKMAEYNPSALWTLDNVLYNNGTGEARETAVREAQEGGAVNILIDILCAAYNSRSFVFSDRASSSENANAAIHCLRLIVVNHKPSQKKMVEWPDMEDMLTRMSEIKIKGNNQIQNATYQDIKNVATDILRWTNAPSAEEIVKALDQKLPGLVQRIKRKKSDVNEIWTLDNVLYDGKADRVRMEAVAIAQKENVVEILLENLQAGYFPKIPYKYSLQPFTSATMHCLRIMVLNDESSRSKMVASENIRDILESLAAHPEAHETLNGAAAHILRDVPEFQNAA